MGAVCRAVNRIFGDGVANSLHADRYEKGNSNGKADEDAKHDPLSVSPKGLILYDFFF